MPIHLLIDWENERPTGAELEQVRGARYRLWILHGPQQGSFSAEQVKAWQPLGKQVRFVQSTKAGKNALDLHVAFSIGEASAHDRHQESVGCYIIVSKDKGFDALFGYLETKSIRARRATSLPDALKIASEFVEETTPKAVPSPKDSAKPAVKANTQRALDDLRAHPKNRPTTMKRLTNHLTSLLGREGPDSEVIRVIEDMKRLKVLAVNGNKLTYDLKN